MALAAGCIRHRADGQPVGVVVVGCQRQHVDDVHHRPVAAGGEIITHSTSSDSALGSSISFGGGPPNTWSRCRRLLTRSNVLGVGGTSNCASVAILPLNVAVAQSTS